MARITIEDCMDHVTNRFQLVRMASIRAKQLKKGARPLLTSEENKEVVMSLREIAAGLVKPSEAPAAEEAPLEFDQAAPVEVASDVAETVEPSATPDVATPESVESAENEEAKTEV
jgi:DNA-directed RNA polymerase subunit omega